MPPLLTPELNSLLEARHHDPFGWLGRHPQPDGTVIVRALRPDTASIEIVEADAPMLRVGAHRPLRVAGPCRGRSRARYRLRAVRAAARPREAYDPYCFGPQLDEAADRRLQRRAPQRRAPASWAPTPGGSTASPACASRSGPPMPNGSAWSATSTAGTGGATRCACGARPASGSCSFPGLGEVPLQVRDPQPALGRAAPEDGSLRPRVRGPAGHGLPVPRAGPPSPGRTTPGCSAGAPGTGCTSPCPSTKCTSAPGAAIPTAAR